MIKRTRFSPRRVFSDDQAVIEGANVLAEYAINKELEPQEPFGQHTDVKRADYGARAGELVLCDPSNGAMVVYLPTLKNSDIGVLITIKNHSASTNAIKLQPSGGATIDGAATLSTTTARSVVVLVSVGTDQWVRIV